MFKNIKDFFNYSPHDLMYCALPPAEITFKRKYKMVKQPIVVENPSLEVEWDLIKAIEEVPKHFGWQKVPELDLYHIYKVEIDHNNELYVYLKVRGEFISELLIVDLFNVIDNLRVVEDINRSNILNWYNKIKEIRNENHKM